MYFEIFANEQQGKTYFSLTVKEGVQQYLESRSGNVELGLIMRDRYVTIRSQLRHWLEFIGKDTKLKGVVKHRLINLSFSNCHALTGAMKPTAGQP